MFKRERPPEGFLEQAIDTEWLRLTPEQQIERDPKRYFDIGWAVTYYQVEREINEEMARQQESERQRIVLDQPRHLATSKFGAGVIGLVRNIVHTPRHRADR